MKQRKMSQHWMYDIEASGLEIDHEIFSMVILSLLLIQEGQLSVSHSNR